jgi:1,2-diacylglycerol 3-alpha-glucosyltransferase
MKKIAILFVNYGPYHFARLRAFKKACQTLGWQAIGIELARNQAEYLWQTQRADVEIVSLFNKETFENIKPHRLIYKLIAVLNQISPDAIAISGYSQFGMLTALIWSCLRNQPAILLSESKENDAIRSFLKEWFKSKIVQLYRAAVVGGQIHKRYLIKLGIPDEAIFLGYNVVGNEAFHLDRLQWLLPPLNTPYFLAINRFINKKNLPFLISAYAAYRQAVGERAWKLVLCGDGELRPQIEQQIIELGLTNFIDLPGFLQQEELLPYFAHARCFIHSSIQEQWGLVVNEAMAAGLPVIVSNSCGCFEDLVLEGINGFGFDLENKQQLIDLMIDVSSEKFNLEQMGRASLEHIQNFSPNYFAKGLCQAIEYAFKPG